MAEASAAAVDHHTHLPLVVDAHLLCGVVVVDLVHYLDLSIVVPRPQSPKLQGHTHMFFFRIEKPDCQNGSRVVVFQGAAANSYVTEKKVPSDCNIKIKTCKTDNITDCKFSKLQYF